MSANYPTGYGPAPTDQGPAPAAKPAASGAPAPGVLEWLATQAPPAGGLTQQIVDQFPEFAAMAGIPEVRDLLELAGASGWSSTYLQEQLWNTKWWKSTPESQRTWESRKLVDPATAGQQAGQMAANVVATAGTLGLHLTPQEVAWYSEAASANGWDVPTLTRNLIDTQKRAEFHAGTVNATADGLRQTASQYGFPIGDASAFKWAKDIASGRQTTQGFTDWAIGQAKAAFPSLAKELDSGLTVQQIADPYMQIAAQTLGLNPATMQLHDPKWQAALQARDAKGNITGPMTTLDWQRHIMNDPVYGYDKSQNGIGAAVQLRDALSKTFGVAA